jgi:hypothetical protein
LWQEYQKKERTPYYLNGDQIKYNNKGEIKWVLSPRYGWNEFTGDKLKNLQNMT